MTTSPAPIPHRHVPHRLILASLYVLGIAALAIGIVLAVRHGGTTSSTGLTGSGVAATRTRTVPAFTAVDLAGANAVTVAVGGTQSVTVHGDDNLIGYVTTTVHDGTLAVGQSRGFETKSPMSVEITVPALDTVALDGSGVLSVAGVTADHLSVRVPGSGVLSVTGTTRTLDATLSGSGDVRLGSLAAQDVTATVSGSGRIQVDARRHLDATVSGSGVIMYAGSPTVSQTITGTGSIIRG